MKRKQKYSHQFNQKFSSLTRMQIIKPRRSSCIDESSHRLFIILSLLLITIGNSKCSLWFIILSCCKNTHLLAKYIRKEKLPLHFPEIKNYKDRARKYCKKKKKRILAIFPERSDEKVTCHQAIGDELRNQLALLRQRASHFAV